MLQIHLLSYGSKGAFKQIEAGSGICVPAEIAGFKIMSPEYFDGAAVVGDIHTPVINGVDNSAGKVALLRELAVDHFIVELPAFAAALVFSASAVYGAIYAALRGGRRGGGASRGRRLWYG